MFTTLKNAFKIKEIRNKLLFTLGMLVVIRLASQLPVPGTNSSVIEQIFNNNVSDAFNFFNAFTGGAFTSFSIAALNITPYITASIIIQLLTIAIPKLEELQKDGENGKKVLASITRYVTVALAIIEAAAMTIAFGNQGLLQDKGVLGYITAIIALTAGSAFFMWIGERINEKGVGNGISVVLVINIVSTIPQDIVGLFSQFVVGKDIAPAILNSIIIIAVLIALIVLIVLLNSGVRKIPVQYAKKMQGRKMVGGNSTNIPLKINTSGVIPVIFASSLMQFPVVICSFFGITGNKETVWGHILMGLNSSNWCNFKDPVYSIGLVVYIALVIFFAYFYTSITFNPTEVAENMKKQGGFIPGIRPGKPTSEYLTRILNAIIFIGAVGLTIVCIIPFFFKGVFNVQVSFAGTSLIIVVSVIVETIKQIESQMLVRNYKGFLND